MPWHLQLTLELPSTECLKTFECISLLIASHMGLLAHYLKVMHDRFGIHWNSSRDWAMDLKFIMKILKKIIQRPNFSKYRSVNLKILKESKKLKLFDHSVKILTIIGFIENGDKKLNLDQSIIWKINGSLDLLDRAYGKIVWKSIERWIQMNPLKLGLLL